MAPRMLSAPFLAFALALGLSLLATARAAAVIRTTTETCGFVDDKIVPQPGDPVLEVIAGQHHSVGTATYEIVDKGSYYEVKMTLTAGGDAASGACVFVSDASLSFVKNYFTKARQLAPGRFPVQTTFTTATTVELKQKIAKADLNGCCGTNYLYFHVNVECANIGGQTAWVGPTKCSDFADGPPRWCRLVEVGPNCACGCDSATDKCVPKRTCDTGDFCPASGADEQYCPDVFDANCPPKVSCDLSKNCLVDGAADIPYCAAELAANCQLKIPCSAATNCPNRMTAEEDMDVCPWACPAKEVCQCPVSDAGPASYCEDVFEDECKARTKSLCDKDTRCPMNKASLVDTMECPGDCPLKTPCDCPADASEPGPFCADEETKCAQEKFGTCLPGQCFKGDLVTADTDSCPGECAGKRNCDCPVGSSIASSFCENEFEANCAKETKDEVCTTDKCVNGDPIPEPVTVCPGECAPKKDCACPVSDAGADSFCENELTSKCVTRTKEETCGKDMCLNGMPITMDMPACPDECAMKSPCPCPADPAIPGPFCESDATSCASPTKDEPCAKGQCAGGVELPDDTTVCTGACASPSPCPECPAVAKCSPAQCPSAADCTTNPTPQPPTPTPPSDGCREVEVLCNKCGSNQLDCFVDATGADYAAVKSALEARTGFCSATMSGRTVCQQPLQPSCAGSELAVRDEGVKPDCPNFATQKCRLADGSVGLGVSNSAVYTFKVGPDCTGDAVTCTSFMCASATVDACYCPFCNESGTCLSNDPIPRM